MKYETNECNVIKDLLPNYMENLVSEDTRTYIENHLKECKECRQVFETIKDEQKQERMNSKQKEKKEIDYLKKYKNKKLIIKSVFLFLVILILSIIIVCSIKNNNINTIFNDMKQTKQGLLELNNYSIETIEHQINFNTKQKNWFKNSFYYKDKNYKIMRGMGKEYEEIKNDYLYYGSIDSNKQIQISEKNKKIKNI